jgi:hypothetical protein
MMPIHIGALAWTTTILLRTLPCALMEVTTALAFMWHQSNRALKVETFLFQAPGLFRIFTIQTTFTSGYQDDLHAFFTFRLASELLSVRRAPTREGRRTMSKWKSDHFDPKMSRQWYLSGNGVSSFDRGTTPTWTFCESSRSGATYSWLAWSMAKSWRP